MAFLVDPAARKRMLGADAPPPPVLAVGAGVSAELHVHAAVPHGFEPIAYASGSPSA